MDPSSAWPAREALGLTRVPSWVERPRSERPARQAMRRTPRGKGQAALSRDASRRRQRFAQHSFPHTIRTHQASPGRCGVRRAAARQQRTLQAGGGLTSMVQRFGQELGQLAQHDLERAETLAGRFQFAEPRILARLAIVQGLLGNDVRPPLNISGPINVFRN